MRVHSHSHLFEKWSSSDFLFLASGGTLRRERFDNIVHRRRFTNKRVGLCRKPAHRHLKLEKSNTGEKIITRQEFEVGSGDEATRDAIGKASTGGPSQEKI